MTGKEVITAIDVMNGRASRLGLRRFIYWSAHSSVDHDAKMR